MNIPDMRGSLPLNEACLLKDDVIVKILLMTSRCDVNGSGNYRPILTSVKAGKRSLVEMLMEAGADLNVVSFIWMIMFTDIIKSTWLKSLLAPPN